MGSLQTIAGWPQRVRSFAEVPEPFRSSAWGVLQPIAEFPVVLFSPEFKTQGYHETPKLLVISGDDIVCLEHRGGGHVERRSLRAPDVHTIECGSVLLHSWLRLEASSARGDRTIEVSFNRVCRELYWEVAEGLRARLYRGFSVPIAAERAKFDRWRSSDYGFMNFAKDALVPGAEVRGAFLQRRIRTKHFKVLRRTVTSGYVAIATQRELIVVHQGSGRGDDAYGGRWTYVRLDRIQGVDIEGTTKHSYGRIRVELPGGVRQLVYEPSQELAVRAFVQMCRPSGPSGG